MYVSALFFSYFKAEEYQTVFATRVKFCKTDIEPFRGHPSRYFIRRANKNMEEM